MANDSFAPCDPIDFLTLGDIPEPTDFVFRGLPAGEIGSIISPGGIGKTRLSLQLAVAVAGGADTLDMMDSGSSPGRVVIINAEDSPVSLRNTCRALSLSNEQKAKLAGRLLIYPIAKIPGRGFDNPSFAEWLVNLAAGSRLVILDNLRLFHDSDENDAGAAKAVLGFLEMQVASTGAAVLFIHHANKGSTFSGQGDTQQASRGSSVWTDNLAFQMNLSKMSKKEAKDEGIDEDERVFLVRVSFPKTRATQPMQERWLRLMPGGILAPYDMATRTISNTPGKVQKIDSGALKQSSIGMGVRDGCKDEYAARFAKR